MTEAQFLHIKLDTIKKLGTTCESQKTEVNRTKLFFMQSLNMVMQYY